MEQHQISHRGTARHNGFFLVSGQKIVDFFSRAHHSFSAAYLPASHTTHGVAGRAISARLSGRTVRGVAVRVRVARLAIDVVVP